MCALCRAEPKEKADGKSKKAKVDSAVAAANVTPAAGARKLSVNDVPDIFC